MDLHNKGGEPEGLKWRETVVFSEGHKEKSA